MDAPKVMWTGSREQWKAVEAVGRRLALQVGCDAADGGQEAMLIACEVAAERATQVSPLTELAMLGRVHDRLIGRSAHSVDRNGKDHGTCRGRLDRNQSLYWRGNCTGGATLETVSESDPLTASADCAARERLGSGCAECANGPTGCLECKRARETVLRG
jgi:hypothetical protein